MILTHVVISFEWHKIFQCRSILRLFKVAFLVKEIFQHVLLSSPA